MKKNRLFMGLCLILLFLIMFNIYNINAIESIDTASCPCTDMCKETCTNLWNKGISECNDTTNCGGCSCFAHCKDECLRRWKS